MLSEMTENNKRKAGFEDSPDPDKCQLVLTKQLDICAKCNKQCVEDDNVIQHCAKHNVSIKFQ